MNYIAPKPTWKAPVGDGSLTKREAASGEVLRGSGFGLVLFGVFLNCLDDGKENMRIQFADDPQVGRACSSMAERVRLPDDLAQAGEAT